MNKTIKLTKKQAESIQLGDVGSFKDPYGMLHKGCIVVKIGKFEDSMLIYSPDFRDIFRSACTISSRFVLTNGMQDAKTRKMNFEYAKQHSGNDNWQWTEDEA